MTANEKPLTPKEVIDLLTYDDVNTARSKKVIFELQGLLQKEEFAEEFLDKDGLNLLLQLVRKSSGSVQGFLLQDVKALLTYVNAIESLKEQPFLIDQIYALLAPSDGSHINLSVAKSTLELLIVICGVLADGHELIHKAAKGKASMDHRAYSCLIPLLNSPDLLCVRNTILFMNILMTKRKAADDLKGKKLLFRWKECGVLSLMENASVHDDPQIRQQLATFQRITNFTIPRSWEEAQKYRTQYEEMRRRYDQANEQLFVYQQQQAKVRLMKQEFARAQETIKALSSVMPHASTRYHPTKRFTAGGGIALNNLVDAKTEPIDLDVAASRELTATRKSLLEQLLANGDMRAVAEKLIAPQGFAAKGSMRGGRASAGFAQMIDDDDLLPPPTESDEEGPPPDDEDDRPPPDDDDEGPPPDDDEESPPPDDGEPGSARTPAKRGVGPKAGPGAAAAVAADGSPSGPSPDGGSAVAADGTPIAATNADGTPALGEGAVATPAAPGKVMAKPPPPPPPPPPGGKKKVPPPPPPGGKKLGGAGPAEPAAPSRLFYHGPEPKKKMKPLHWDKWNFDDQVERESFWGRIHSGKIDCTFDYEEFENMFAQKEATAAPTGPQKPEKVLLIDGKTYMNLSIVLHKLPAIPNIQRAIMELDDDTLKPPMIEAMVDPKLLTPEVVKEFMLSQHKKTVEEYEPPEQFVAMAISIPEFRKRCSCWLTLFGWEDGVEGVLRPIGKIRDAVRAVVESKHLPYFFGLLLAFGNMMNYGNSTKGNVPAISLTTLDKLDASKDNRGKTSLMQHLIHTAKARNPDSLELADELKPLAAAVSIKFEDLEKSVQEAVKAVEKFEREVKVVKKALVETGTDANDPFLPRMAAFSVKAAEDVEDIKAKFQELVDAKAEMIRHLGCPEKKPMSPEEVFGYLSTFAKKVGAVAEELQKEKKKAARKGQKLDSGGLDGLVGKLQEEMVNA